MKRRRKYHDVPLTREDADVWCTVGMGTGIEGGNIIDIAPQLRYLTDIHEVRDAQIMYDHMWKEPA